MTRERRRGQRQDMARARTVSQPSIHGQTWLVPTWAEKLPCDNEHPLAPPTLVQLGPMAISDSRRRHARQLKRLLGPRSADHWRSHDASRGLMARSRRRIPFLSRGHEPDR